MNLSVNLIGGTPYESGALFSFDNEPSEVILRVGVSFVSPDQACANAESEVGTSSFEDIVAASKALWNEKLGKIEIDVANTPPNVTELLYSSLYRASLTPVSVSAIELGVVTDAIIEQRHWRDTGCIREHVLVLL